MPEVASTPLKLISRSDNGERLLRAGGQQLQLFIVLSCVSLLFVVIKRSSGGDDGGKCSTDMESGRGQYLYDDAGAKYLDCVNSAALVGHCAPKVASATGEALERLGDDWGTASEGPSELERLLSLTLPPNLDCFLFCDSGSEAIDLAVRLARLWHCNSARLPASARRRHHADDSKSRKNSCKTRKKSTKVLDTNNCQNDGLLSPDSCYQPYKTCDREGNSSAPGPPGISSKYRGETSETNVPQSATSSYYNGTYCKSTDNSHPSLPCPTKMSNSKEVFEDPTACTSTHEAGDYGILLDRNNRTHSSYTSCDSDFSSVSSGFTNDSGFYSSGVSGGSSAADVSSVLCLTGDIAVVEGSFHGCTESLLNLSSRMLSSGTVSSPRVVVIPAPDLCRVPGVSAVTSNSDLHLEEKAVAYYLEATKKVLQDALKDGTRLSVDVDSDFGVHVRAMDVWIHLVTKAHRSRWQMGEHVEWSEEGVRLAREPPTPSHLWRGSLLRLASGGLGIYIRRTGSPFRILPPAFDRATSPLDRSRPQSGRRLLMREHCGALCISDEVQCGLGRLGDDMWGFQALGVEPDIVVAGKGLGNGFPMAVTITSQEIASKLGHMRDAYRCSGVQSAVGSAVLDSIQRDQLLQGTTDTGRHLTRLLNKLKKKHSCVGAVRGRGLMHAVELVWSRREGAPASAIAEFLVVKLRRVGVVIAREGIHRNVLLIMPPLTFDELDSATLIGKLDEALALVPHNFSEEVSKDQKASRRYASNLTSDAAGFPTPGPSGTEDQPRPHRDGRPSRSEFDYGITVPGSFQPSTSSGYPSSRLQRSSSSDVAPSDDPHSNYPMPAEPIYPALQSEIKSTRDKNGSQSNSRVRDAMNFSFTASSSGTHIPGQFIQEETTKENYQRQSDSASNSSYPYPRGYQQNPHSSNYDGSSYSNSSANELSPNFKGAATHHSQSNSGSRDVRHSSDIPSSGSSALGYSGASNSLASPERNSSNANSSKSKLSKKTFANKKGKPDIFSNIDFEVRDSVPPVADVLSGVPGIMQSRSTFVNPPVGGRGSRPLSSRVGSSSRSAHNQEVRSTPSSQPSTSREGVVLVSPVKTENLHPDEIPRGCCITNVGLGMIAPQPVKTSPLHGPRITDYEDFDD